MNKKIISIFTLFTFIVFSISCSVTSMKNLRTTADRQRIKGKIISVVKTSGEYWLQHPCGIE